jgi:hypothetical protein
MSRTPLSCEAVDAGAADGPATDPIRLLGQAVERQLWAVLEAARTVKPDIDGSTFGSLLITYGVEVAIEVGPVGRAGMADYLRLVADAVDKGEPFVPSIGSAGEAREDPPF